VEASNSRGFGQRQHLHRLGHTPQNATACRGKPPISKARRKGRREKAFDAGGFRGFHAAGRHVDGLADDREVEPVGGTDIAVQHPSVVETKRVPQRRLPHARPQIVQYGETPADRQDACQRGRRRVARQKWKECQHRIADELQYMAAMFSDRSDKTVEAVARWLSDQGAPRAA
jgi:hypothetical protein